MGTMTTFTCRLPTELYESLAQRAEAERLPVASLIQRACAELLRSVPASVPEKAVLWLEGAIRQGVREGLPAEVVRDLLATLAPLVALIQSPPAYDRGEVERCVRAVHAPDETCCDGDGGEVLGQLWVELKATLGESQAEVALAACQRVLGAGR